MGVSIPVDKVRASDLATITVAEVGEFQSPWIRFALRPVTVSHTEITVEFQSPWIRFAHALENNFSVIFRGVSIPVDKVRAVLFGASRPECAGSKVSIPVDKVRADLVKEVEYVPGWFQSPWIRFAHNRLGVKVTGRKCFNPRG